MVAETPMVDFITIKTSALRCKVAVYAFEAWDSAQGRLVGAPVKATMDAILLTKGIPDLSSMELVDPAELDLNGCHTGGPHAVLSEK